MILGQYLLALGDWSLDTYAVGPDKALCYVFFVLATFITQLTMFNMLIAIMGDTFDKITENRDINSIKSKLDLMADLVAVMDQTDKEDETEIFFFVVMPEVDEGADAADDEWAGTISTMKKMVKKNSYLMKRVINYNAKKLKDQVQDMKSHDDVQERQFKQLVESLHENEKSTLKGMISKIDKSFDKLSA